MDQTFQDKNITCKQCQAPFICNGRRAKFLRREGAIYALALQGLPREEQGRKSRQLRTW